jgi:hypothetical protein
VSLAQAVLAKARELHDIGFVEIAEDLRMLVRELADTEDPEPDDEPAAVPSMRWPSDRPTLVEPEK